MLSPINQTTNFKTTPTMKKILVFTLLISFTGFSQQLQYATGGSVKSENKKLNPTAVRELMKNNEAALTLYNAGRNKKTWGNVLFYGGFGLGVLNLYTAMTQDPYSNSSEGNYTSERANPTLAIVGGVMILASIPIKMGYTRKVKAAINEYNKGIVSNDTSKPEVTLLAGVQSFGIRIQF